MMRASVFTSEAAAAAFVADLDRALGYPRDGVNIGGGVHAPAEQSRTLTHAIPLKHPTRDEWAVPVGPRVAELATEAAESRVVSSRLTKVPYDGMKAAIVAAVDLSSDWFPAAD